MNLYIKTFRWLDNFVEFENFWPWEWLDLTFVDIYWSLELILNNIFKHYSFFIEYLKGVRDMNLILEFMWLTNNKIFMADL